MFSKQKEVIIKCKVNDEILKYRRKNIELYDKIKNLYLKYHKEKHGIM